MKLAHAELPKITKATRKTLDAKVLKEAVADLQGSFDFAPHAYTDGTEYATYTEALSAANLTIREVADASGQPANMLRRRVWDADGKKDRKQKGKWTFAISWRSAPPKPRAPRKPTEAKAA